MGFVGVYRAVYDYTPASEGELAIVEGDVLLVLEKSTEDDWWRAKKRAIGEQEEEPEGLIPSNYIEEIEATSQAKALYDYSRQTDEELSFAEDASLQVFDTSDPDWTLVGLDGEYGFAPANYIELSSAAPAMPSRPRAATIEHDSPALYSPNASSPVQSPATALAGLIQQRTGPSMSANVRSPPPTTQYTPEASDEEETAPSLPRRPMPTQTSTAAASPTVARNAGYDDHSDYHMYNIHEMVSHLGRKRKLPMVLGVDLSRGVIMISPEKTKDGPQREWTAEKLTNYSIEGKHVFMELVRPSKSIDFHAGNKDTAQEIVSVLGELAGAARAEGLREVIAAGTGSGHKRGQMLYEFMAQGDDEVTVAVGDEVIVLDDTKSEEWWMVRRLKNGNEGVVPSSYVEILGGAASSSTMPAAASTSSRSYAEQNRMEEERLAREAAKTPREAAPAERSTRQSRADSKANASKSKPDASRVRTWTDRSGTFKVEAEFLGLKDGKIHLHKTNGVKIAVPAAKMSVEDLDYVERATGQSLDNEKPRSDAKKRSTQPQREPGASATSSRQASGAVVPPAEPSKYDWFDFFLACGCNPQICERYSAAFEKDQMGEENLQDVNPSLLRTLGVKEGDILRIMRNLDNRFGRVKTIQEANDDGTNGDSGGLFSGSNGELKNNTRKGRPAPAVETNDTVDPRAFETSTGSSAPTLLPPPANTSRTVNSGFEDDAWDVKPSQTSAPARVDSPAVKAPVAQAPLRPATTGAMAELSLLSPALQPTPAASAPLMPALQPQPTGATSSFFDQLAQPTGPQNLPQQRQRPQAGMQQSQNSFLPPPPSARSVSAPQNHSQAGGFGQLPLQPQMTGYQSQIAPPGQSLNEMSQQRYQQQFSQPILQPQPTGYGYNANGLIAQPTGYQTLQAQPTGYAPFQQQPYTQAPYLNGQMTGSPFADPRPQFQSLQAQPTGYQQQTYMPQPLQPMRTGINGILPPPLQPQPTGMNGYGGGTSYGSAQAAPPPTYATAAPLLPQKTGPAPPIRFGVASTAMPLVAQPTGRRANLAAATPQNPFGF